MSFQIKKTTTGPNAAAQASWPLDLEDFPKQFKCTVCLEVLMGEIFQCPNGHTVCKFCCQDQCAQCRSPMKFPGKPGTGRNEDFFMRNRVLEQLLDSIQIACPFRKNGCLESILGRANLKAHVEKCTRDGNCIQLCSLLGFKKCEYWARTSNPLDIWEHFRTSHKSLTNYSVTWPVLLANASEVLVTIPVEQSTPYMPWSPKLTKAFNSHFIVVNLFNKAEGTLSFVGLQIEHQLEEEQKKTEIQLEILSKNAEMPDLVWRMPAMPILKSATVLANPPVRIQAAVLKKFYLEANGELQIRMTLSQ